MEPLLHRIDIEYSLAQRYFSTAIHLFNLPSGNTTWRSQQTNLFQFGRNKETMTQEATQLEVPNFEATTDGKKIFTPKQWLERFRQYTKRKYKMDIAELIWGEEITQADWATKENQIQDDFVWGIGPEALYQMTRAEYKTEPDKIAIKELIRLFNEYFLPKRNTYHNRGEFFWTKQTEAETPEDFWRRLIEIEKECNFESITAEELLISKFMTAITDKKLRDKLMKVPSRPNMLVHHDQNPLIWVPSRPNKRSREEIAEIDGELIQRANRLGGGYQPMQVEEQIPNEIQAEEQPTEDRTNDSESEGESQVIRGDNLPIVDLKNYNTEGKEAHYVQINQIIGAITEGKKLAEETIKKAEMDFMMDLKSLIAKSATDAELNRIKLALNREDHSMAPENYRQYFENISSKWGLYFLNDRIIVPTELRKKLLDTLHFGHAGTTKMTAEAKIFWWPNINKDIEDKVKFCIACMSSGKNLKYQLPKNESGKLKTLTEPGQEIQIAFNGKLHNKKIERREPTFNCGRQI